MIKHVGDDLINGVASVVDLELVGLPMEWLARASPWRHWLAKPDGETLWIRSEFPEFFFKNSFLDAFRTERQAFSRHWPRAFPRSLDKIWTEMEFLKWLQSRAVFYNLPSIERSSLASLRQFCEGLPLKHPPLISWMMYLPFVLARERKQVVESAELQSLAQWRAVLSCEEVFTEQRLRTWWINPSWQNYNLDEEAAMVVWIEPTKGEFHFHRCLKSESEWLDELQNLALRPKSLRDLGEHLAPLNWPWEALCQEGLFHLALD